SINDTLGHPIGDKLLKEVASRLKTVIRPADMITRFGGDEFVVLQVGTERYQDAKRLAQRLARTLKDPFEIDGHRIDIGASIGIAMAPMDGVDAEPTAKESLHGALRRTERRRWRSSLLRPLRWRKQRR